MEIRQKGVGWITMFANKLYVLTPYHVATHATALMIQCRSKFFPVQLKSYSASKDLALLTFEPSIHAPGMLSPLLWLNGRTNYDKFLTSLSPELREQMSLMNPDISPFKFTDLIQSGRVAGALLPQTGNESSPIVVSGAFEALRKRTRVRLQRPDEGVLSALQYPLIMEGIGIRPGFSGAPAYIQLPISPGSIPQHLSPEQAAAMILFERLSHRTLPLVIVGMITKTETNGTNSAAISIEDLVSTAKQLLSIDGNLDEHSSQDDLRFGYDSQPTSYGEVLLKTVSFKNQTGQIIKLRETCDTEYRHSSDVPVVSRHGKWLDAAKALQHDPSLDIATAYGLENKGEDLFSAASSSLDTTKPSEESLRIARGGGDYGDGGGDADTRYTYLLDSSAQFGMASPVAAFKTNNQCLSRGLQLDDGRTLTSARARGRIVRLSGISDLTALAQSEGPNFLARLNETAIYDNSISLFCSRDEFRKSDTVFFETPRMFDRTVRLDNREYRLIEKYGGRASTPTGQFLKCAKPVNQPGAPMSLTIGYSDRANAPEAQWLRSIFKSETFETQGGTGESRLQDSHKVSFRLAIPDRGAPQGLAVLGNEKQNCVIKLSEKNVMRENPWRYSIRDPRLEVTIDLNSDRRILNIRITSLDRECLSDASREEVWLIKSDFETVASTPETRRERQ
jgi:hypothetical protein